MRLEPPIQTGLTDSPLFDALIGRCARHLGVGMEIPSGPLAYSSEAEPLGLTQLERSILVAAGVGTPVLFAPDDGGTYFTYTRDLLPDRHPGVERDREAALDAMVYTVRAHTVQLSNHRIDLPAAPPRVLEQNLWMVNAPGSTLFIPVADASGQVLGFMAMALANGNVLIDDLAGRPAGNLAPFLRSGLLQKDKRTPLSVLQQMAYGANVAELAFMGHNIVLTLQAMGLGGLYLTGLN